MPRTIGSARGRALRTMMADAVKARGYSLRVLALRSGLHPGTVGGMLYNAKHPGSVESWARLLDAAGVELAWQLRGERE